MNGILYIPYINTLLDESSFEYNGPDFDYISKLSDVENSIIGDENYVNNVANSNKTTNSIVNNKQEQLSYYEFPCKVLDANDNDETIDNLLKYYKNKNCFLLSFLFDQNEINDDCIIELMSWIFESKKVLNMHDNLFDSEEKKLMMLPKRTFKLKINKAISILDNCFLFDTSNNKFTIAVNEINFMN